MFNGAKLRELRENHHLNTHEFAHEIGISQTLLSFYERNLRDPKADMISRMAQYFKVPVGDLFIIETGGSPRVGD